MTTTLEYALMAGSSYRDTTNPDNRIPFPVQAIEGWNPLGFGLDYVPLDASGFEATAYSKVGPDGKTEIVISFAGTGPGLPFLREPDWWANLLLYSGEAEAQLKAAAMYYERIRSAYADPNVEITFTGHSTGGGLAA